MNVERSCVSIAKFSHVLSVVSGSVASAAKTVIFVENDTVENICWGMWKITNISASNALYNVKNVGNWWEKSMPLNVTSAINRFVSTVSRPVHVVTSMSDSHIFIRAGFADNRCAQNVHSAAKFVGKSSASIILLNAK